MISTNDYLSQLMEEIPQWLADYRPGDRVSFSDFMSGRVGYYPGSGLDGHLVKVGGMSHSVHCFLYVDYLETREHIVRELDESELPFQASHRYIPKIGNGTTATFIKSS